MKYLIFYLILAIVLYVTIRVTLIYVKNINLIPLIALVVFFLLAYLLQLCCSPEEYSTAKRKWTTSSNSCSTSVPVEMYPPPASTLSNKNNLTKVEYPGQTGQRLLQFTPQKMCADPFFWKNDPLKRQYCSQFSPEDLSRYRCPRGFNGAPISFEYTAMSDSNWENKMCSSKPMEGPMAGVL